MLRAVLRRSIAVLPLFALLCPAPAQAVPVLQLYAEGATYDEDSESWVLDGASTIRLWTLGNVDGHGGHGEIYDVRLAVSYEAADGVDIVLAPSTTGDLGDFFDPSESSPALLLQTVIDGSRPAISDRRALPGHGTYASGVYWQEFALGDFTLTDSPIADFIDSFPTAPIVGSGQINVYEITVSGTDSIHVDLYGYYLHNGREKPVFAPFSHDASALLSVPEPAPLALMLFGLLLWFRSRFSYS